MDLYSEILTAMLLTKRENWKESKCLTEEMVNHVNLWLYDGIFCNQL